jgi:zinc D-Ala-D-Ala carboxypeptidase
MPHPAGRPSRTIALLALIVAALALAACGGGSSGAADKGPRLSVTTAPATPAPTVSSMPLLPADKSLLTLVTTDRALSSSYVPPDLVPISPEFTSSVEMQQLRRPAAEALTQMLTDARAAGLFIKVNSAYRSYAYQSQVLNSEVVAYGCAQAVREVASPGHSEHQLGLAADLTSADVNWDLLDKFGDMPEGRWLLAHAAQYGFVLSYPKDKEVITGYIYEPWHFRYVTVPVAQAIDASGKTPTEYLRGLGDVVDTNTQPAQVVPPPGCR